MKYSVKISYIDVEGDIKVSIFKTDIDDKIVFINETIENGLVISDNKSNTTQYVTPKNVLNIEMKEIESNDQ